MDAHPEQQYFRWKEEICKFIFEYWSYLLPDKERKGANFTGIMTLDIGQRVRLNYLLTLSCIDSFYIESPTWNNTVASVLSVQNHIFLSGVETKGASGMQWKEVSVGVGSK